MRACGYFPTRGAWEQTMRMVGAVLRLLGLGRTLAKRNKDEQPDQSQFKHSLRGLGMDFDIQALSGMDFNL